MNRTPRSTSRRASRHCRPNDARHVAVEAVELERLFGFLGQVDRLGRRALHLVGQLVAGDARRERLSCRRSGRSARCCTAAACRAGRAAPRRDMPSGGARSRIGSPTDRSSVPCEVGRHVAARPVLGAADRPAAGVEHHDEAGQVLVHAAQAVVHPRAQARAAAEDFAASSSAAWPSRAAASRRSSSGGTRCRRRTPPRCGNRSLTHLPHWPYCLNFQRGSTMRPSFLCPPRPKVFTFTVLLSMPIHRRLVVERVDLARPAVHEQEDDALGLCRTRRRLRRERIGELRLGCGGLRRRKSASSSRPERATPVNPAPISQRNSRRVRPAKTVSSLCHSSIPCELISLKGADKYRIEPQRSQRTRR